MQIRSPNDYISSFAKLGETQLSALCAISNIPWVMSSPNKKIPNMHIISMENIETFDEYRNLHVKTDALLLSDIFQNFRKLCYQHRETGGFYLRTLSLGKLV